MLKSGQSSHPDPKLPPASERPVAREAPNTLTLSGIGLGVVRGSPGTWQFESVGGGAYVMCRQETNLGAPVRDRWVRYGRTTWQGWVVEVDEENLDADVPQSGERNHKPVARDDLMLLYPDERYRLFWTFDREHFMEVKAALDAGMHDLEPSSQLPALDFDFVRLVPQNLEQLDLLPWLIEHKKLDEHCRDILATHLLNAQRGYVRHKTTDPRGAVAMFDVTPAPIRALLLVEFLQWYALMAAERSGEHLAALYRACSLIEASQTGAPDAVMESMVSRRLAEMRAPPGKRAIFEKYRVYAWKCAAAGQRSQWFQETIPTLLEQVSGPMPVLTWQNKAHQVWQETADSPVGPAEHPALEVLRTTPPELLGRARLQLLLDGQLSSLVNGYFGLYTLGRELEDQQLEGRGALLPSVLRALDREWEQTRNQYLPETCRRLLDTQAPYPAFLASIAQVETAVHRREALLERYIDACAIAEHSWWDALKESRNTTTEQSLWKQISPRIKWLAEAFKASGKTLSGLVEARLAAYSLAFKATQELLECLFRHEVCLSGTVVNPSLHYLERVSEAPDTPNFRADLNLLNGELVVTRGEPIPDVPPVRVELQLLQRVGPQAPDFHQGSPRNAHAYQVAVRLRQLHDVKLVVPVDLAELKQRHTSLPKAFARCAEVLNVTRAAATIADNLRAGKGFDAQYEPAWELTKGVLALAESHQAVLKAMQRPLEASTFLKPSSLTGVKLASTVASGIDGLLKIGKGATLLCSDDAELAYELRQGHAGRAATQAVKGMLQIAQGAMGVIAAVPATAPLAATPIGLVIVVGAGLLVATLDVALDATQEFTPHVEAFRRVLDAAKRSELEQSTFRCSSTTRRAVKLVEDVA